MPDYLNRYSGRRKYLFMLLLLLSFSVVIVTYSTRTDDGFDVARREVLLRKIGDNLLRQSGDTTSRVLPVEKIAENEYRIRFENDLTFHPDSLVNTTRSLLASDPLTGDYVVNVLTPGNARVVYGFAISGNKKDDIVACQGRRQPTAFYVLNIRFKPKDPGRSQRIYLLGTLPCLAFMGLIFLRFVSPRRSAKNHQSDTFRLGSALFDPTQRQLTVNRHTIDLTGTETRLLRIFASSPNQTIERSRLQKEVWEDQGVIVGRSLDVFISKLRTKLAADPCINIVVVRGKGYRLEIIS